jgi:hypothetical protein
MSGRSGIRARGAVDEPSGALPRTQAYFRKDEGAGHVD